MQRVDDSDTTWLVYADWLDDTDRHLDAEAIRTEIATPDRQAWYFEYRWGDGVGVGVGVDVGAVVGGGSVGVASVGSVGSVASVGSVGVGGAGVGAGGNR